ncbi:MAG: FGGY family carbohydrate kinase [Candidatus Borkfalkiaceae bacterium]|nr:FGGY family carbohydrate kinase [Clostridia bacterium]MDY6222559.1 FGGY family carbohydrate kinase [Christensenellaceae bacterium]
MKNLYIDVGSTYIKYALNDGETQQIAFPPPIRYNAYLYEVSIEAIMNIIEGIVRGSDVDRVFFSVQMHGYVLSDEDHIPVTEYISWRDTLFRSLQCGYPFSLGKNSGTALKSNLPALSVYARSIIFPDIVEKTAFFDTLGSYIVYRLTGKHIIHITDACPTGFYLLPSGKVNSDLVNLSYFRKITFPAATDELCLAGMFGNTEVYLPVGDQQASAFGVGLTTQEYLFNTGTASQICCLSDSFLVGDFESRPYFGDKYLCTITGLLGGGSCADLSDAQEKISEEYNEALKKLPVRSKALATGGLVKYNEALFKKICENFVSSYVYIEGQSAVNGLKKLSRLICR